MQELEKILEEIESRIEYLEKIKGKYEDGNEKMAIWFRIDEINRIKKIIRKHMNDGWISVNSHGLPSSSEHDFRFWVTVQYKNGFRRTLKATWNYYNNHFVYQNGKIISEDVVAYRYYSAPKPYRPERSEGE